MLHLNKTAPDFRNIVACHKGEFTKVNLVDYKGKWLVLFFYPRDFTFVCPTELRGFAKHESEFKALNCVILAASTDSEWSHKAWFERDLAEVAYPILADTTQRMARDYGVLNEDDGSAERGLFFFYSDGSVEYIFIFPGSVGR